MFLGYTELFHKDLHGMDNFYDLLQKIQKRPDLYLGRKSIFSLQAFLDGYYRLRYFYLP